MKLRREEVQKQNESAFPIAKQNQEMELKKLEEEQNLEMEALPMEE